jgi:hypothetical protein
MHRDPAHELEGVRKVVIEGECSQGGRCGSERFGVLRALIAVRENGIEPVARQLDGQGPVAT